MVDIGAERTETSFGFQAVLEAPTCWRPWQAWSPTWAVDMGAERTETSFGFQAVLEAPTR